MKDQFDNDLSSNSQAAVDAYVRGIDLYLAADAGIDEAFQEAIFTDESFTLAYLGLARNYQVTGRRDLSREALEKARLLRGDLDRRESSHLEVMCLIIKGSAKALPVARAHIAEFPRDVMIAQACLGVFGLIGFSGQPGREAEHLACASMLTPHYGDHWWFQGQLAFAQMEAGQLAPAARSMAKALAGNPRSANTAHHNAHLYYETGETAAGMSYLCDWLSDYDRSGLMSCHLNWHVTLWELSIGAIEAMWSRVDKQIAPGATWGPPLNVLSDMTALLYRAELAGIPVDPERWQLMSQYAEQHFPGTGLGFADVHAALAHARAGNHAALTRIIAEARGPAADQVVVLAKAFASIETREWSVAMDELFQIMSDHERIGGSRAQRDLIELALVHCLRKQGKTEEAKRWLPMRRPHINFQGLL